MVQSSASQEIWFSVWWLRKPEGFGQTTLMRYNWVTGPSLPGSVGMGVNIPHGLATSVFICLKSPKPTSVTRMLWAQPEDLGDKGVGNLSLQKAAL